MIDAPDLSGKRIVITGASRGIGLAIASCLAELGASLALVARDRSALDAVVTGLAGGPHTVVALDVSDESAWGRESDTLTREDKIDGLVTAAGIIGPIGPLGSWEVGDFRRTLAVNVTGTLLAVLTCLPALKRSRGAVVTLSGGGGTAPLPRFDAYAASKAAVVRLTENLARDLSGSEVRVNSVAPGFVVTDMHGATIVAGPELVGEEYFERTRRAVDSGEGDSPEFVSNLTAFLISDEAHGITGKLLSARWDPWRDGGFCDRLRLDQDFCTLRRIDGQFFEEVEKQ